MLLERKSEVQLGWLSNYCYLLYRRKSIGQYAKQLKILHQKCCTWNSNPIRKTRRKWYGLGTWNGSNCMLLSHSSAVGENPLWDISPTWSRTRTCVPKDTLCRLTSSLRTFVFPIFLVQQAEEVVYSIWTPWKKPDHYWRVISIITLLTGHHFGHENFRPLLSVLLWKLCLVSGSNLLL